MQKSNLEHDSCFFTPSLHVSCVSIWWNRKKEYEHKEYSLTNIIICAQNQAVRESDCDFLELLWLPGNSTVTTGLQEATASDC